MSAGKVYDLEYKIQAVKLANEIGQAKAATELGIPRSTVYTWIRMVRLGRLDLGANMQATLCVDTLDNAMMAYPDLKGAIIHSDRSSLYMAKIVFLKK